MKDMEDEEKEAMEKVEQQEKVGDVQVKTAAECSGMVEIQVQVQVQVSQPDHEYLKTPLWRRKGDMKF